MARLRNEVREQKDLVQVLRLRLADAEASSAWLPWVLLAGVGALALAGWLGLLLVRVTGRSRQSSRSSPFAQAEGLDAAVGMTTQNWSPENESRAEPAGAAALRDGRRSVAASTTAAPQSALSTADSRKPARRFLGGLLSDEGSRFGAPPTFGVPSTSAAALEVAPPNADAADTSPAARAPLSGSSSLNFGELTMAGVPPRAISVEELIDLEQQVEFFLVLGQADSAVDLLVGHIRTTGGTSALPYLKLLEVYRHLGDIEGYERTRTRFNQRFNAYAPEWEADLEEGHALEDYGDVLQRLTEVWRDPIDAMAELEVFLFRRDQGELFDLPAYRDLLLLYAMVRDVHQQGPSSSSTVDVLLPLDVHAGEGANDTTLPLPSSRNVPRGPLSSALAAWASSGDESNFESSGPHLDLGSGLDIDLNLPSADAARRGAEGDSVRGPLSGASGYDAGDDSMHGQGSAESRRSAPSDRSPGERGRDSTRDGPRDYSEPSGYTILPPEHLDDFQPPPGRV